jgi:cephalosporin hydroxylase
MDLRHWLLHHQKEIVFDKMTWMGTTIWKNPLDAWIYQEILYQVKPDIVVEIGSRFGGSTLFFAHLLDIIGHGQVVSIDPYRDDFKVSHDRVIILTGRSDDDHILADVEARCQGKTVFVIQDGDHSSEQVLKDLNNYSPWVSVGSYFVVEDGIVDLFHHGDGMGLEMDGPLVATEHFLKENHNFIADPACERYLLTYNPKGFLRRIA